MALPTTNSGGGPPAYQEPAFPVLKGNAVVEAGKTVASPLVGVLKGSADVAKYITNPPVVGIEEILKQILLLQGLTKQEASNKLTPLTYGSEDLRRLPTIESIERKSPALTGIGELVGGVSASLPLFGKADLGKPLQGAGVGGLVGAVQAFDNAMRKDTNAQGEQVRGFDRFQNLSLGDTAKHTAAGAAFGAGVPLVLEKVVAPVIGNSINFLNKGLFSKDQQKIGDIAQGEFKTAGDVYKKLEAVGQDLQKQSTKLTKQYDKLAKDKESLTAQLQQGIGANPQFAQTAEGQALQGQLDDLNIQGYNTQAQLKDINYNLEHATTKGSLPSKAVPPGADSRELLNILSPPTRKLLGGGVGERAAQEMKAPLQEGPPVNVQEEVIKQQAINDVDELFNQEQIVFQQDMKASAQEALQDVYEALPDSPKNLIEQGKALLDEIHTGVSKGAFGLLRGGASLTTSTKVLANAGVRNAAFLHDVIDYTESQAKAIATRTGGELINAYNRLGVLKGTTATEIVFDILNTVKGSDIVKTLSSLKGKTSEEIGQAIVGLMEGANAVLDKEVVAGLKNLPSIDALKKGAVKWTDDHIDLLTNTVKTMKELGIKDGLKEEELLDAYMYRIWKTPRQLSHTDWMEKLKKKDFKTIKDNLNAKYLEERFGKDGYVKDAYTSVLSRIEDSARKQAFDPALAVVERMIHDKGNLHPFIKELAKDFGEIISGVDRTTPWSEGIKWIEGNVIKNILNTEPFAQINTIQNVATASEYGPKIFHEASEFWTDPKTHDIAKKFLKDDVGLFGLEAGNTALESWGFRKLDIPTEWIPKSLQQFVRNQVAKVPEKGREAADVFFNKGIALGLTEGNNVTIAALSAIKDHFKLPWAEIQKRVKSNPEVQSEANYVANKAVNRLIYTNNRIDKSAWQRDPVGSLFTPLTKYPIATVGLFLDWAQHKPQAIARWGNLQTILGGLDALKPGAQVTGGIDYQQQTQEYNQSNPLANLPSKAYNVNYGARISPLSGPVLGTGFTAVMKKLEEFGDPTSSWGDKAKAALYLANPIQAGLSVPRLISLVKDFSKGKNVNDEIGKYGTGKIYKYDRRTKQGYTTTIDNPANQYLDSQGISKYGGDAVVIANVKGDLKNKYQKVYELNRKVSVGEATKAEKEELQKSYANLLGDKQKAENILSNIFANHETPFSEPQEKAKEELKKVYSSVRDTTYKGIDKPKIINELLSVRKSLSGSELFKREDEIEDKYVGDGKILTYKQWSDILREVDKREEGE